MARERESRDEGTTTWSYTKSRLYESCPRAFYFRREARVDSSAEADQVPTDAVNLGAIMGIAVHRGIASQIDEWADGENPSLRDSQQAATAWIESVWSQPQQRIVEAANGKSLDEGTKDRIIGGAKKHLKTFFQALWPRFRDHDYVLHEKVEEFDIGEWIALVKLDLCTVDEEGHVYVTDWKTGQLPVLDENSLQLNAYALWAREQMGAAPEEIRVQLAHTKSGQVVGRKPNEKDLEEAKSRITAECQKWATLNRLADFPAKPEYDKCIGCPFLSICEEGMSRVQSD